MGVLCQRMGSSGDAFGLKKTDFRGICFLFWTTDVVEFPKKFVFPRGFK